MPRRNRNAAYDPFAAKAHRIAVEIRATAHEEYETDDDEVVLELARAWPGMANRKLQAVVLAELGF